jgi:hypothetical protein
MLLRRNRRLGPVALRKAPNGSARNCSDRKLDIAEAQERACCLGGTMAGPPTGRLPWGGNPVSSSPRYRRKTQHGQLYDPSHVALPAPTEDRAQAIS